MRTNAWRKQNLIALGWTGNPIRRMYDVVLARPKRCKGIWILPRCMRTSPSFSLKSRRCCKGLTSITIAYEAGNHPLIFQQLRTVALLERTAMAYPKEAHATPVFSTATTPRRLMSELFGVLSIVAHHLPAQLRVCRASCQTLRTLLTWLPSSGLTTGAPYTYGPPSTIATTTTTTETVETIGITILGCENIWTDNLARSLTTGRTVPSVGVSTQ